MALSKQLLILVSMLFLLIFGVNLGLSIKNTKTYLESESLSHAQDTATSLGLSLSPYMKNPSDPIIKAMVSAIFDMGYYGNIRLLDANGKALIELANDKRAEGVPAWFIQILPMSPAKASSEITTGWTLTGSVHVTINPAYAYRSLYQQIKTSFYYSLLALAISILLLLLVLRLTLASLKRIDQLARQIADGHFETITELPYTSEIKNVAISMNTMSQKIKGAIASLNSKLEMTAERLMRDEVTGLYKKSVFETDVAHLILDHTPAFLQLIKVDSLFELVKEHGSDRIDDFLQAFATLLKTATQKHPELRITAYRFFGGEFALVVETEDPAKIEALCKELSATISDLGARYSKSDLAHIGVTPINTLDTPDKAIIAAQEAYEQARLIGANRYYIRRDAHLARDVATWRELVFNSIDNKSFSVTFTAKTYSFADNHLLMQDASVQTNDSDGNPVAIAPFIAIAEKYAKIVDLDKAVIEHVLQSIREYRITHAIAVNLSTRTIKNADFLTWLDTLFKTQPVTVKQLIFSFSAYAVSKDTDTYVNFFYTLHKWGGRVMIKRFEPQSMALEVNKRLKPDFVRLAREIGNGISACHTKRDFAYTLHEMSKLLDITVLAEGVSANADYQVLKSMGIQGASRD